MNLLKQKQLLQAIHDGDTEKFSQLYKRYYKPVYYLAVKMVKNDHDALDIVQGVFLNLFTAILKDADHIQNLTIISMRLFAVHR